jgi:hypothetical protein
MAVKLIQKDIDGYIGLSSDIKPTTNVQVGTVFYESDTSEKFIYSGTDWFGEDTIVFEGKLDEIGNANNAVLIFSPYKRLIKSFKGDLVKVKRTSDYESKWFGYLNDGNLDVVSLLNWVGNSDGLVTEVSNQANNGYNIYQNSISSKPKIVVGGIFQTQGLLFDGLNDYMECNSYITANILNPPISIYTEYINIVGSNQLTFSKNNGSGAEQ